MAKTHLRNTVKSSLRSIKDVPFSGAEIKEIEEIQKHNYNARKQLKEDFCDRNNRMISEVNEYFLRHRKSPVPKYAGKTTMPKVERSVTAPKEQVTSVPLSASNGEIKITFKEMRIEGNTMIFKV